MKFSSVMLSVSAMVGISFGLIEGRSFLQQFMQLAQSIFGAIFLFSRRTTESTFLGDISPDFIKVRKPQLSSSFSSASSSIRSISISRSKLILFPYSSVAVWGVLGPRPGVDEVRGLVIPWSFRLFGTFGPTGGFFIRITSTEIFTKNGSCCQLKNSIKIKEKVKKKAASPTVWVERLLGGGLRCNFD